VILHSAGLLDLLVLSLLAFLLVKTVGSRLLGSILLGAVLGGMVGFMQRPAVPVLGRLPFDTVITRGEAVRFDELVRPNAERSFDYIVFGGILGAVIFGACASMAMARPAVSGARFRLERAKKADHISTAVGASNANAETAINRFCTNCGSPLRDDWAFCGACGTQRA